MVNKLKTKQMTDCISVGVETQAAPSTAAPHVAYQCKEDRQRAVQMYGADKVPRIRALEILADMKFNEAYSSQNTPLWPNIPLNL